MAVVGFRYLFGIHMGIGRGPVDELVEIKVGDRMAWRGSIKSNAQINVDAYNLFGGEEGEGGVQGTLDVMFGEPTQTAAVASPKLNTMLGGSLPGFRRAFTVFFDGIVTMMNPYPKPWQFRVRRALKGWDGEVWEPALAVIPMSRPLAAGELPPPILGIEYRTTVQTGAVPAPTGIYFDVPLTMPSGSTLLAVDVVKQLGIPPYIDDVDTVVPPLYSASGDNFGWEIVAANTVRVWSGFTVGRNYSITFRYSIVVSSVEDVATAGELASIQAMNPAHMIYECLTNREWGRGHPRSMLNAASFLAAAQTLFNEGFGLCLRWVRRDSIQSFVQQILDHIGGVLYTDRTTALLTLKLIRNDYVFDDLPLYDVGDANSGLLEIRENNVGAMPTLTNEVIVEYRDPITNETRSAKVQNNASLQASGGRFNSIKRSYPGLPTPDLARRVAQRDLKATGVTLRRFTVAFNRRAYTVAPGSVIRIRDLARSIPDMAVRVGRVEDGTQTDGRIVLTVMQDVFSTPRTSFAASEPISWVPPVSRPCIGRHTVFELPYFALARTLAAPDFALVDETSAYFGIACEEGQPVNAAYDIAVRDEASTPDDVPTGDAYYCGYEPA